ELLLARTWQAISGVTKDPALVGDLMEALRHEPRSTSLHNALGIATARAALGPQTSTADLAHAALAHFEQAVTCDPTNVVACLNLAQALTGLEQVGRAAEVARGALATLERLPRLSPETLDACSFPIAYDLFRVEWERAAWSHAGNAAAEGEAKRQLLRW